MNFESMSLAELRAYAKDNDIKGTSALKKQDLIEKLNSLVKNSVDNSEKTSLKSIEPEKEDATLPTGIVAEKKTFNEGVSQSRQVNEQRIPGEHRTLPMGTMNSRKMISGTDMQRNTQMSQGQYQQRTSGYQPRQSQEGGYQQRYNQINQNQYQQRTSGYQSRQPQEGTYQARYNQTGQNGYQARYNQDTQGQYQQRYNQEPQGGYHMRYNQSNEGYYSQRQQQPDNARINEWSKPVQSKTYADNEENVTERVFFDTGISREGVLELVKSEGYGFIRCDNYLPGDDDVYVSPTQIRKFNLKTGDLVKGNLREKNAGDKFQGLAFIEEINGESPEAALTRPKFEELTPVFPHERIHFETPKCTPAMRLVDILSPVGKGQRGMIVSQPKAGKTTLLKQMASAITVNHPDMKVIILLIDERPEEVTDIKESIKSDNVEVIYSTFDEIPENHKRVSEMVIERARRLVEHGKDVCILLDSITRLARAYNLTVQNTGRTLSGGLDPSALYMPKKFFGAARCMREGGSLTILATALVDTGSRMDDVVFEEFKGTGNMEIVLDRSLSEKRIFPAIDLPKSGTRREDLLLSPEELEASYLMRNALNGAKSEEAIEIILNYMRSTTSNEEFINIIRKKGIFAK